MIGLSLNVPSSGGNLVFPSCFPCFLRTLATHQSKLNIELPNASNRTKQSDTRGSTIYLAGGMGGTGTGAIGANKCGGATIMAQSQGVFWGCCRSQFCVIHRLGEWYRHRNYFLAFDTSRDEPIEHPTKVGAYMTNPKWGNRLCESFLKVLFCPVFLGELNFLRYAIKVAMCYRLGRAAPILSGEDETGAKEFYRHRDFLEGVKEHWEMARRSSWKDDQPNLVSSDLELIIEVWDDYAEDK